MEVILFMSKQAVITCGFPHSGKTTHYKSHYNEYSYINVNIPSLDIFKNIENYTKSLDDIYIEGTNPSIDNRNSYSQFLKKRGYSVTCLWFNVPLEGILSHSYEIPNFQEQQQFINSLFSFQKQFQPPTLQEPFTVLKKIPFLPEKRIYGDNKAIFTPVYGIFANPIHRSEFFVKPELFEIINSQFVQIISFYERAGYKIILVPSEMQYEHNSTDIIEITKQIAKKAKLPFTDIVFDERNGKKMGIYKMAHPEVITKAAIKHKINLEQSIMIGNENFEKALSMISGCKYYFSKDIFFSVQSYVKIVLEGKRNDTNY